MLKPGFLFVAAVVVLLQCVACKKDKQKEAPLIGTCKSVTAKGTLKAASTSGPFVYKTADGWTITIDFKMAIRIEHDTYKYNLELWGVLDNGDLSGNHENLNGKHIKDRLTNKRSIILPNGTKITMHVQDVYHSQLTQVSIYEGAYAHHFNPVCGLLEYSENNAVIAKQLDDQQVDGETAGLEMSDTGLIFVNIYNEEMPGNKVMERVLLGQLYKDRPNTINDYFDDPRIAHT